MSMTTLYKKQINYITENEPHVLFIVKGDYREFRTWDQLACTLAPFQSLATVQ